MKTKAYATRPNIILWLACTMFILPSLDPASFKKKSLAAPRVDDGPGGRGADAARLVDELVPPA